MVILRASPKMYLTFGTLLGLVTLLVCVLDRESTWRLWSAVALAAGLAAMLIHVWRLEVRLTSQALTYRTLFRTRSMRLAEIWESRVSGQPEPLLMVFPVGSPAARIVVNLRPFPPSEVRSLLAIPALKVRLPKPR